MCDFYILKYKKWHCSALTRQCLNPCCNGNDVELQRLLMQSMSQFCFNPCYNGNDVERRQPGRLV